MQPNNAPIDNFNGYYQFLNNDYPTWTDLDGILFPSVTTAYQASRTNDIAIRKTISEAQDYETLKKIVLNIKNPPNWNSKKYKVMQALIRDKFKRNKQIAGRLLGTKDRELINKYSKDGQNEYYWGIVPDGSGNNNVGKILKGIRQQISKGIDHERWIQHHNLQGDPLMFPTVNLIVEKEGKKIEKLFLQNKNAHYFGSGKQNDYKLDHSSISKNHACIFFDQLVGVNLVDLNSTNGTSLNAIKINPLQLVLLSEGDIIVFGNSSRKYIVNIDRKKVQQNISEKEKQIKQSLNTIQTLKNTKELSNQEIKNKIGYNISSCILVEDAHERVSHKQIAQLFSQYGQVNDVRMCIDRKTGKNTGSIIVYFTNSKDAQSLVIKRPKLQSRGKILSIKLIDNYEAENIINKYNVEKKQEKDNRSHQHRQRTRDKDQRR